MFSVIQIEYNGADGRSVSRYEDPALILSATRHAISFPESFLIYKWTSPGSNNPPQDTEIYIVRSFVQVSTIEWSSPS